MSDDCQYFGEGLEKFLDENTPIRVPFNLAEVLAEAEKQGFKVKIRKEICKEGPNYCFQVYAPKTHFLKKPDSLHIRAFKKVGDEWGLSSFHDRIEGVCFLPAPRYVVFGPKHTWMTDDYFLDSQAVIFLPEFSFYIGYEKNGPHWLGVDIKKVTTDQRGRFVDATGGMPITKYLSVPPETPLPLINFIRKFVADVKVSLPEPIVFLPYLNMEHFSGRCGLNDLTPQGFETIAVFVSENEKYANLLEERIRALKENI